MLSNCTRAIIRSQPAIRYRCLSYGITYSGGQASEGQGGFYGSGGSRKSDPPSQWQRPQMLALAADVTKVTTLMKEVDTLETLLQDEVKKMGDVPSAKYIEIKSKIKKLCTQTEFLECLNRLVVKGEPVWGLSSDERELIIDARQKVNDC